MKCNVMLLVIATALATTPAAGRESGQSSGVIGQLVSWMDGDQGQA